MAQFRQRAGAACVLAGFVASIDAVLSPSSADEAADAGMRARRMERLMAEQPDRARMNPELPSLVTKGKEVPGVLDVDENGRPKKMNFSVSVSELAQAASKTKLETLPGIVDFWVEGKLESYANVSRVNPTTEGNVGVLYFGNSVKVKPGTMIGAMAQIDRAEERSFKPGAIEAATAEGWMAGPYISTTLAPGVTFDGRTAWGETESGYASEAVPTQLVKGKLTASKDIEGWKFAPSVGVTYLQDGMKPYQSGDGTVAVAKPTPGRVDVVPELSRRFATSSNSYIEPKLAVGGFLAFDDPNRLAPGGEADLRLKAEAGVALGEAEGSSLQATGGVETAGDETAPSNWTGKLQLNVPLGRPGE